MTALDDGFVTASRRRRSSAVLHIVGVALLFVSSGMALSTVVEAAYGDGEVTALLVSTALTAATGALLWRFTQLPARVSAASTFAAVAWTWIAVAVFGAVPFVASGALSNFDEALFESISGFTTTGSTVLFPIEDASRGVVFWRAVTQWFGGMGMVVLAVAVLPFLGVGGLELISAEAPGDTTDRLAPRVSATAKRLWLVYVILTAATVVALLLTGDMAPKGGGIGRHLYDAVTHAFATLSTGGFSTYDTSVATFDSLTVELVLIGAMLAGATSFTLHWAALRGRAGPYGRSAELRSFAGIVAAAVLLLVVLNAGELGVGDALRHGAFNTAAVVTTTGFGTADFALWGAAAQLVLLLLMVVGGMTGSTAGGAKVLRIRVTVAHALRELRRARHPRAVLTLKLGSAPLAEAVVARMIGFVLLYLLLAGAGVLALGAFGHDVPTAAGSTLTAIGNIGPGLGDTGPTSTFLELSRPARAVPMVLMLVGRVEILPVLLMFATLTRSRRRSATVDRRIPTAPAAAAPVEPWSA